MLLKNIVVKRGSICNEPTTSCIRPPNDEVEIISDADSLFSLREGSVVAVVDFGNGYGLIVKTPDEFYICYSCLEKCFFNRGDIVRKNDPIGLIKAAGGKFSMTLMIGNSKGKMLRQQSIIDFLLDLLDKNTLAVLQRETPAGKPYQAPVCGTGLTAAQ